MKIGKRVNNLRLLKDMSGNQLAKAAGISQSTISQIEADVKSPTIPTLAKVCDALDVSLAEFFSDKDYSVSGKYNELHQNILKLTPRQQGALIRVIDHISEKRGRPRDF
jgi:transcriptional regulator with XRE-family HTH domain